MRVEDRVGLQCRPVDSIPHFATMRWNPELGVPLRAQLVRTWIAATNAGGALGFLPPVDEAAIAPTAQTQFLRVGSGTDDLLVVEVDDAVAGWLVLECDPRTFAAHLENAEMTTGPSITSGVRALAAPSCTKPNGSRVRSSTSSSCC